MRAPLVLVIEDDVDLLEALAHALPMLGFAMIGLSEIRSPHSLIMRDAPDLVLMDIMLRNASGIEHAEQMPHWGSICPIVAMSASPQLLDVARDSGLFVDHIAKPFDMFDLAQRLRGALDDR